MPSAISRRSRSRFSSRKNPSANRPQPTTPIFISTISATGTVLTVVFNQPISLNGVPQYAVDVAGVTPVSAAMTSPTTITITYSGAITAATGITIPYEEPAVRNSSGGYVGTHAAVIA